MSLSTARKADFSQIKRNLPNEHGGWVLLGIGIAVGVGTNPGWWQWLATLAWLGLFLVRVPFTRLLDRKGGALEWRMAALAAAAALAGLGLWGPRPEAVQWACLALPPGVALVLMRKRRLLRSPLGEVLSALAVTPIIPSVATAGGNAIAAADAVFLWTAMTLYMLGSVLRVRAVAFVSRRRTVGGWAVAGAIAYPAAIGLAWWMDAWPMPLAVAALPAALAGGALLWLATRRRMSMMQVGLWETAVITPFVVVLLLMTRNAAP